jgi:hypothetical protein
MEWLWVTRTLVLAQCYPDAQRHSLAIASTKHQLQRQCLPPLPPITRMGVWVKLQHIDNTNDKSTTQPVHCPFYRPKQDSRIRLDVTRRYLRHTTTFVINDQSPHGCHKVSCVVACGRNSLPTRPRIKCPQCSVLQATLFLSEDTISTACLQQHIPSPASQAPLWTHWRTTISA